MSKGQGEEKVVPIIRGHGGTAGWDNEKSEDCYSFLAVFFFLLWCF
ncbi:MAG: hypothetical protein ACOX0U_10010 [Oscillospiraceae bacterium]